MEPLGKTGRHSLSVFIYYVQDLYGLGIGRLVEFKVHGPGDIALEGLMYPD